MRVLIACEFSGIVRRAFRSLGHEAWSCDLREAEDGSCFHYQRDVISCLNYSWDMMIAHPPCTHLAVSGARWFANKKKEQIDALNFVRTLLNAPIPKIALENPISVISSHIRRPDQIIQPWQFGHGETKATCLWLKNMPLLQPTNIVQGRDHRIHRMPPGPNREREKSNIYRYCRSNGDAMERPNMTRVHTCHEMYITVKSASVVSSVLYHVSLHYKDAQ